MGGAGAGGVGIPGSDMLGSGNNGAGGMGMGDELPEEGTGGKGGDATTKAAMALAVLALVGGLYLVLRKKKKKPVKRK